MGRSAMIISFATIGASWMKCEKMPASLATAMSGTSPNSGFDSMPSTSAPMMAPAEAMPTRPKESSSDFWLSLLTAEAPADKASKNGTVSAPVVAPEASKDTARKNWSESTASTSIMPYVSIKNFFSEYTSTIRTMPSEISKATPIDTSITSVDFDTTPRVTSPTWSAKMCKSGSAIEMTKPRISPMSAMTQSLPLLTAALPKLSPIGVMPRSTPIKNIVSPKSMKTAPNKKRMKTSLSSGTTVKFSITTSSDIGKTVARTSLNFSLIKMSLPSSQICLFL